MTFVFTYNVFCWKKLSVISSFTVSIRARVVVWFSSELIRNKFWKYTIICISVLYYKFYFRECLELGRLHMWVPIATVVATWVNSL